MSRILLVEDETVIRHELHRLLARAGYDVQVNRPYAGGFITEYYGNPARGVQSLHE